MSKLLEGRLGDAANSMIFSVYWSFKGKMAEVCLKYILYII